MKVRHYKSDDRRSLEGITDVCFAAVSIDCRIEAMYGPIGGHGWQWRKRRDIQADIEANPAGVLVAEQDGQVVGYITTRVDPDTRIGRIPNFAVLPAYQKQGIGGRLVSAAMAHLAEVGMEYVRIETLADNDVGIHFYPKLGFKEIVRQVHFIVPLAEAGGPT